MKINGKLVEARYTKTIEFNRAPDAPIQITLRSVNDYSEFEKICPEPDAGWLIKPGEGQVEDKESETYAQLLDAWSANRIHYMLLASVQGITWETVVLEEPATWGNWEQDMWDAGFTRVETTKFHNSVFAVNGLSADAVRDAEKNS